MSGKLLAYEYVHPGFEMIIEGKQVKAWNLWWNTRLTDDPEAWDEEIRSINEAQDRLGELTRDQRLIRAQIAEFCRYNPLFPQSVDILCKEIGENRFSRHVTMGCEGRGFFNHILKEHEDDWWKDILEEYSGCLESWLAQGQVQTVRESKVHGFLGKPTEKKREVVKGLISKINTEKPSAYSLMELAERIGKDASVTLTSLRGRPFNCFGCDVVVSDRASAPKCPCCYIMFTDACLLCAGMSDDDGDALWKFKRFIEENILAYSLAINSWLKGEPPKSVTEIVDTNFLNNSIATQIPKDVHFSLGEKNEVKEWLAACLLKTLKENQRWHEGKEMIDEFSDAFSWSQERV